MGNKTFLSNETIKHMAEVAALCVARHFADGESQEPLYCYPIPRGGVPAAYALGCVFNIEIVDTPEEADFFFDDIVDSGATADRYQSKYSRPVFALVDKRRAPSDEWFVFPWEGDADSGITDNILRMMQFIGEDVTREGLKETPDRVARAYKTWFGGYKQDVAKVFKVFKDGGEQYDEMVVVRDIPFYSHCEHHIAPFFGTVTIAYIPQGKIVGLSKLSRLVDIYARRLQVQERLTNQIVDAIEKHLQPLGVACCVQARHLCMESRGIEKQGHSTLTNALRGVFRTQPETRAEFMRLLK